MPLGSDRVAAVVARVLGSHRASGWTLGVTAAVDALDAAGLLLTEERRKRLRDHLSVLRPVLLEARLPKTCEMHDALLRELAGDGGSGVEVPTVITTAPRRMAANPNSAYRHVVEHDEHPTCRLDPPCQPVAAAGARVGTETERIIREDILGEPAHEPKCIFFPRTCDELGNYDRRKGRCSACERADAAREPAHEHGDWRAIDTAHERVTENLWRTRVIVQMCGRGDCTATREVGHGA